MSKTATHQKRPIPLSRDILITMLVGSGLLWVFWWPLWSGGGLIGGDIYPYYFPQKAFLADSLKVGEIPLWNPLVGFGYPTLGESQTGVLYPPNLFLYSQFDLNSAYNYSQLFHYFLAYLATWAFLRRLRIGQGGALIGATAFVFGWFPARICLEWAIIGGAWFAAILWVATVYLQTGKRWALSAVALFLGFDLLAGHYNLAFITVLMLGGLPFLVESRSATNNESNATGSVWPRRISLGFFIVAGFAIAAVQLLPSLELKSVSQRQDVGHAFSPTYGHLPPAAISQLWQPWSWYGHEESVDVKLQQSAWLAVKNATNQAEAFLYCGLLTISLVLVGCFWRKGRAQLVLVKFWRWLLIGALGLLFATGWPTHFLSDVPGFGFFRGPGRYSMVTAFALAVLSSAVFDQLLKQWQAAKAQKAAAVVCLLVVLVADLWTVSRQYQFGEGPFWGRQVFYATLVDDPPIRHRDESQLRQYFAQHGDNVRLYASGQNVPTLLGVSSLPVYLGLGPEIYETDQVRVDFNITDVDRIQESMQRLRDFGVTHLLLESAIDESQWDVTFAGEVVDALLNRAFARREPFYLYTVNDSPGRVALSTDGDIDVKVLSHANHVEIELTSETPIDAYHLRLADLHYPGWEFSEKTKINANGTLFRTAQIENQPLEKSVNVRWIYRPNSVKWGAIISLLGITFSLVGPFWFPRAPGTRR